MEYEDYFHTKVEEAINRLRATEYPEEPTDRDLELLISAYYAERWSKRTLEERCDHLAQQLEDVEDRRYW